MGDGSLLIGAGSISVGTQGHRTAMAAETAALTQDACNLTAPQDPVSPETLQAPRPFANTLLRIITI